MSDVAKHDPLEWKSELTGFRLIDEFVDTFVTFALGTKFLERILTLGLMI